MKYVRVYESDCYPKEYITTYLNHCEHVANLQNAGFDFEGCIVKQADTIQELCDFIIFKEDGKTRIRNIDQRFVNYQLKTVGFEFPNENIKLAIETDEGIIFAAKKKGVLPNGEIDLELL